MPNSPPAKPVTAPPSGRAGCRRYVRSEAERPRLDVAEIRPLHRVWIGGEARQHEEFADDAAVAGAGRVAAERPEALAEIDINDLRAGAEAGRDEARAVDRERPVVARWHAVGHGRPG